VTDSTQELARGIRRERTVVVARQMTAGRGRMGHSWLAEPGGLWFTVILSSPLGELLSLAAGSALAASLSHF
jgi:BirA family biotin operon repressor/biotin-[acetyl-CoA-carboxylase] ligase